MLLFREAVQRDFGNFETNSVRAERSSKSFLALNFLIASAKARFSPCTAELVIGVNGSRKTRARSISASVGEAENLRSCLMSFTFLGPVFTP